jgi:hypothetical protein
LLHRFGLERHLDVRAVKPMVCNLFPVVFDAGLLRPAAEILENSLICLDQGQSLYRGSRESLGYYFGAQLITELDALEAAVTRTPGLPQST